MAASEKRIVKLLVKKISVQELCQRFNMTKEEIEQVQAKNQAEIDLKILLREIGVIALQDLNKALKICEKKEYLHILEIQVRRVGILLKLGRKEEALTICSLEEFQTDQEMQYLRAKTLYLEGSYQEALMVCDKFQEVMKFRYLTIDILRKLATEAEYQQKRTDILNIALNLCNTDMYPDDLKLVEKKLAILKSLQRYKEALAFCEVTIYHEDPLVITQKISIFQVLGRYDEALSLCNNPQFTNNLPILQLKVSLLIHLNRYTEAIDICQKKRFINNPNFQLLLVSALIKTERYQEALSICNRVSFSHVKEFYFKKEEIKSKMASVNKTTDLDGLANKDLANSILQMISDRTISLEEITASPISAWQIIVLTTAFYEKEKYPAKVLSNYLQKQVSEYATDASMLANIDKLKIHLRQNLKFFDINFYLNLLQQKVRKRVK